VSDDRQTAGEILLDDREVHGWITPGCPAACRAIRWLVAGAGESSGR
jgi:hypothetical protein